MQKKHIILASGLGILAIGILGAAAYFFLRPTTPSFRTVSPETRDIKQTIHASGLVKASQAADLSFTVSGRIKSINVAVGDKVKAGQVLAELDNAAQGAQVNQARAALAQRKAGATPSQVAIYQAAVDAAAADLAKTKSDTDASIATAQMAVDAAQNNLKQASGDSQSQIVLQAYQNANTSIQTSLSVADNALLQADNILGVDSAANASFAPALSLLDPTKLSTAKAQYQSSKSALADLKLAVSASDPSDQAATDGLVSRTEDVLAQVNVMLSSVTDMLHATVGGGVYLSQASLSAMETTVQQTQAGVQAQRSVVIASQQSITNAKNSLASYTIAYSKAQQDLANAKQSAAGAVAIKQSLLEQARANLANAQAPVRPVDLAPLQAALNIAAVAYNQTRIVSPIDGVVSQKNAEVGSVALPNVPVLSVINQSTLQTEILVSEAVSPRSMSATMPASRSTLTAQMYLSTPSS